VQILTVLLGGIAGSLAGFLSPFAAAAAKGRELRTAERRELVRSSRSFVAEHHTPGTTQVDLGTFMDDMRYVTLRGHLSNEVTKRIEAPFLRSEPNTIQVTVDVKPGLYGWKQEILREIDRLEKKWKLI
jgi:gas vesicle protein